MKNTGIVRRIDELGRIVIPMEYRKMHRINIGDPMEILVTDKGEVVLKKIGLESEYVNNAAAVIDSVCENFTVIASDGLRWRVGSGIYKDKYIDKVIDQQAISCFASNKPTHYSENGLHMYLIPVTGMDSYGVLMVINDKAITEVEKNTVAMLSNIIIKLTERF